MGKLDELIVGVSPLTGKIYAGYVSKRDPRAFTSKVDVTDQVLSAVSTHMQMEHERTGTFDGYGWSSGELIWKPHREQADTNAEHTVASEQTK